MSPRCPLCELIVRVPNPRRSSMELPYETEEEWLEPFICEECIKQYDDDGGGDGFKSRDRENKEDVKKS